MDIASRLGLHESLVEREYNLLITLEEFRTKGLMKGGDPLVLGGGHGVRAYLPQELQRFSIDLDFYSNAPDIHQTLKDLKRVGDVREVGYGIQEEKRFKRYDSAVPTDLRQCTVALVRSYHQSFKLGDVPPEFSITVTNTHPPKSFEMRKPKSYISVDYVKGEIPVLPASQIIAGKMQIIPHRPVKDLYKDIFDIYALTKLSDARVTRPELVASLKEARVKLTPSILYERFKETSGADGAKNAIKLPKEARRTYLDNWDGIYAFVKEETFAVMKAAGCLSD